MTPANRYDRRLLLWAALACYAGVSGGYILFEVPGLGLEHFFYLAIAVIAVANGPFVGACGGLFATVLYGVSVVGSPHTTSANLMSASTGIRLVTYVATGTLIGWFARSNHTLVERMRVLAERDPLTGLLNWRSFESALKRRCAMGRTFTVLVGDLDDLKVVNDRDGHVAGNELLRSVGEAIDSQVRGEDEVARIGGDEFGVLASVASEVDATALCARIERHVRERNLTVSFGWALYPADGRNPMDLFKRADERLYKSKVERKAGVTRLARRIAEAS